jgi:23S rRNA (uracil1939-C5)-methyltransferase
VAPVVRMTVESIAAGGDGIGRAGGLAVFVPRTAPGDVADVAVSSRGRFGRGRLVTLVNGAATRVTPRCQHYVADGCGGCQLQHVSYAAQLDAKRRIVRDALSRIARRDVELPPIDASPLPWQYRAKLTLTMRNAGGTWTFGLHRFDDPGRIFQLHECPITEPAIVQAWRQVRGAAAYLPQEGELRGAIRRVGDDLALLLEGGHRWDTVEHFSRRCDVLRVIRWKAEGRESRTMVDRRHGSEPAGAFEQVNPAVAASLRAELVERAVAVRPADAIDAYAGTGATARALVAAGIPTTAIEVDRDAAAFAEREAPPSLRVVTGRVEDAIGGVSPAELIVLNPPRAGIHERVARVLEAEPRIRTVLYVSCDPATLARDISRLPSYRVSFVKAFDMFPQTAHVETLCELVRDGAAVMVRPHEVHGLRRWTCLRRRDRGQQRDRRGPTRRGRADGDRRHSYARARCR